MAECEASPDGVWIFTGCCMHYNDDSRFGLCSTIVDAMLSNAGTDVDHHAAVLHSNLTRSWSSYHIMDTINNLDWLCR